MHEASEVLRVAVPIVSVGALAATISIARVWVRRGTTSHASEGSRGRDNERHLQPVPVQLATHEREAR